MGYLIAVALQFRIMSFSYRYLVNFVSLAIVFTSIHLTIAEDIVGDIRSICEKVRNKRQCRSMHNILAELIDFMNQKGVIRLDWAIVVLELLISFCTSFRRLNRRFIQIYRITLIVVFLGCIAAICLALLMIQLALVQVIWHCVDPYCTIRVN